jgi:tRNA G18 (ribose-2'-O)-methylase SpoU
LQVSHIDSADDPRLAPYALVARPEALLARGSFIAEGRLVVERLVASRRYAVDSVLVNAAGLAALEPLLAQSGFAAPVYVCAPKLLAALSGHEFHRGCLALVERPAPLRLDALLGSARSLVVLESVANADNVGSVFRNAAAFGVDAVLLGPGCADPLYRKAIRTSMAQSLRVPFANVGGRDGAWPDALQSIRARGFELVALTPAAGAIDIAALSCASERLALLVGAEGDGLSPAALEACQRRARIPLCPDVDSLNLGVATGIALERLMRGRGGY